MINTIGNSDPDKDIKTKSLNFVINRLSPGRGDIRFIAFMQEDLIYVPRLLRSLGKISQIMLSVSLSACGTQICSVCLCEVA